MRISLKTAPAAEPVSQDEAKRHLRVDGADDNALITGLIATAREFVEKETKRALITQTWELVLDEAKAEFEIPLPPLQKVSEINVIDDAGAETLVSDTIYNVDISGSQPGRVRLKDGCSWPEHRGFASFIVTFDAGYGDAAASVPGSLKQAVLIALAILYEDRGAMDEGKISKAISGLCWPYKIFRL